MSTLRGKPFPASIYEEYQLKAPHFRVFWALYNELGVDDQIPKYFLRKDFVKALRELGIEGVTNFSAILETLNKLGYIEARMERKSFRSTFIYGFEVRISPDAWNRTPAPRPVYPERNTRAQRRELQRLRSLDLSSEE